MIKLAVALALAVALVGIVASAKFSHGHFHEFEPEWEHEQHHLGHGPVKRGHTDDEEWGHRTPRGGQGSRHGGHGHRKGFSSGRGVVGGGSSGGSGGSGSGGSGVIGGGAAGFKNRGEIDAGVHSKTRLRNSKGIEGQKGFISGKKKGFQAGVDHRDSNDREGHLRHQEFDKDKVTVHERDRAVNDDAGFHSHNDRSDSAHIGGSESKFFGAKKGFKAHDDNDFEHEGSGSIHGEQSEEGGVIGVGGVFN